jgi:hypothetical protein
MTQLRKAVLTGRLPLTGVASSFKRKPIKQEQVQDEHAD